MTDEQPVYIYRSESVTNFLRLTPYHALKLFGVPTESANAAVKHYPDKESVDRRLKGTIHKGDSYYLCGPAGTRKTVFAAALLYHYAKQVADGEIKGRGDFRINKFIHVSVPRLLFDFRQTYKKSGDGEAELLKKMENASTLVLDDLGAEKTTDWSSSMLHLILDHRYETRNYRTTIITSNLSLETLVEKMEDARIASRVIGWCSVVKMGDKDLRTV